MVTISEALRSDQGIAQVGEQGDGEDELEDVGERHMRSSPHTNAAIAPNATTVRTTISTSSIAGSSPCQAIRA